jgi:hypothetical protein
MTSKHETAVDFESNNSSYTLIVSNCNLRPAEFDQLQREDTRVCSFDPGEMQVG